MTTYITKLKVPKVPSCLGSWKMEDEPIQYRRDLEMCWWWHEGCYIFPDLEAFRHEI